MKKILLIAILLTGICGYGQTDIFDPTTLRNRINTEIITNNNKQITGAQLNKILNGLLNIWPSFSNGITQSPSYPFTVKLGGNLNQHTTINGLGTYDFSLSGIRNLTLSGANVTINLGSDQPGDMYTRSSLGRLQRIAAGGNGQVLQIINGIPQWGAPPLNIPTLQQVTDKGNRTLDSVFVHSLFSSRIHPDSSDKDDYEIIVLPDLQYMTQSYPHILRSMFDWIVATKATNNIKAVLTVGDLTDDNTVAEYDTLMVHFNALEAAGIPSLPVLGNHDYEYNGGAGIAARSAIRWNEYFGLNYWASRPYFGSALNGNTANYFINLDIAGKKYTFIALEFFASDSALQWAANIIDSMPDREVIICTHAYIDEKGQRSTDNSLYGVNHYYTTQSANNGVEMWNKLFSQHPNISMVFAGHFILGRNFTHYQSAGVHGNIVNEFMYNKQQTTNGGNGHLLRLRFSPRSGTVHVSAYSPFLNAADPDVTPFTINYPRIQVNGELGVKGLFAHGPVKFDSTLFLPDFPTNRVPFIGNFGQLRDNANLTFDTLTTTLRTNIASANLLVSSTTGTYPTQLVGGAPGAAHVTHGAGNYGLVVTRYTNDANSTNLTLFKTRSGNPGTNTAMVNLDEIGRVNFMGVNSSNQPIVGAEIKARSINVTATNMSAHFLFGLRNDAGAFIYPFIIYPDQIVHAQHSIFTKGTFSDTLVSNVSLTTADSSNNVATTAWVKRQGYGSGGGGGTASWGNITGTLANQADLQSALDAKESLANKATDFSTVNNTKYPTVQAVINYLTANYTDKFHNFHLGHDITLDSLARFTNDSTFVVKSIAITAPDGDIAVTKTISDSTLQYNISIPNLEETYLQLDNSTPSTPPAGKMRMEMNSAGVVYLTRSNGVTASLDFSGLTANRTYTLPDLGGTVVTNTATQTLSNKTLTGPKMETTSTPGHVWTATGTDGSGAWQAPSGGGGSSDYIHLFEFTTTAGATEKELDFSAYIASYRYIVIEVHDYNPSADNQHLRFELHNGTAYKTTNYIWSYTYGLGVNNSSGFEASARVADFMEGDDKYRATMRFIVKDPAQTTSVPAFEWWFNGKSHNSNSGLLFHGTAYNDDASAVHKIKFIASSVGTFDRFSGTVYGIK